MSSSYIPAGRNRDDFVFLGVEPGDYSLVVWPKYGGKEAAYQRVSIDRANLMIKVQTNTGARVSGRVIVDGRPAEGGPGLPNVSVSASRPPRTYGVNYSEEPVFSLRGTDRFELIGLRGPTQLSGFVTYGKLVSIRRGNDDLSAKVIDFAGTENLDDVVVELTTQVARLEVTVPRPSATSSAEPLVFVFPEDRQRWRPHLVLHTSVSIPNADGDRATAVRTSEFTFLPGRYLVIATDAAAVDDPANPALLEKLASLATPVTLSVGETTKLTVPLTKARR
jgi:hypothetical protein